MSKDSFTPRTTEQRLPLPLNGTIYTTTRLVASEKPTPTVGSTMESELGSAWSDSRIISVTTQPQAANELLVIQHARIPAEADQLASNWEADEVAIGGKTYDAVTRTVIFLSSSYSETSPARKSAMPVELGSPFTDKGYVLYDRACVKVGSPLEPVFRVEKRTFIIPDTTPGEGTGTWGIEVDAETVVDEGTIADAGFGIKSCKVSGLGNGWAVKERVNYPGSPATLYGLEIDEATKIEVEIEKSLVSAASALGDARTKIAAGWFAEVQPIDKWHSILICSKIPNTFDGFEQTWKETQNINLPNELTEIGIIWDTDGDYDSSFVSLDNISLIEVGQLPWQVNAEAAAAASVAGRPYVKIKDGFSGAAEVTVTRKFSKTPFTDTIEAHIFRPVRATMTVKGMSINRQGRSSKQGTGRVDTGASKNFRGNQDTDLAIIQLGPFEHNGVTLTQNGSKEKTVSASAWSGSVPGGGVLPSVDVVATATGEVTLEMPASSIPFTGGATFIRNVSVSPWRLGYWVREIYEAKIPS